MEDQYRVNEFENLKGGRSQTSKGQESDAQRRYGDILGHSYPFPLRHARMPVEDRAAQFAPFAALTGYDAVLAETARLTQNPVFLTEKSLEELNAQLRRGKGAGNEVVETGEFVFDFGRMEYRKKGKLVELSKTEQRLLRLLVQNRGTTLSRGDLVDRVWTDGAEYVEENALSVTVKRLRDKLEEVPSKPRYLKTVYGIGYTWAVK